MRRVMLPGINKRKIKNESTGREGEKKNLKNQKKKGIAISIALRQKVFKGMGKNIKER